MRLINCTTYQLHEFFGKNIPGYAILSHTWGDDEVSFADFTLNQAAAATKEGYRKIAFTCKQALDDGIDYAWVDTCCIDKSSSAELSEAINSMYRWYQRSTICYAYLSDVSAANMDQEFPKSRWFTRGWTLQELLAPNYVMFYDQAWKELGTKSKHADRISEITAIDKLDLIAISTITTHHDYCIARRMSWASRRETTRAEDTAYCLLGIFNINMPLLYGEGTAAFKRLQEEIMKKFDDDSLLAWGLDTEVGRHLGQVPSDLVTRSRVHSPILAHSPAHFEGCRDLVCASRLGSGLAMTTRGSGLAMTNQGLRIQLPLVSVRRELHLWIGLLNCSPQKSSELVAIVLRQLGTGIYLRVDTIVVGPRVVAPATLEEVIIVNRSINGIIMKAVRPPRFCYHIMVNESETFQDIGFNVTYGGDLEELKPEPMPKYRPVWDQAKRLLTVQNLECTNGDVILPRPFFCFTSRWHASQFTIYVGPDTERSIVRTGLAFTMEEREGFYNSPGYPPPKGDANDIIITDMIGRPYRVDVTMHRKKVFDWVLYEVNVDAIPILADIDTIGLAESS